MPPKVSQGKSNASDAAEPQAKNKNNDLGIVAGTVTTTDRATTSKTKKPGAKIVPLFVDCRGCAMLWTQDDRTDKDWHTDGDWCSVCDLRLRWSPDYEAALRLQDELCPDTPCAD